MTSTVKYTTPAYRKLRGYAFDPSMSLQMETAEVNKIVYKVVWEPLETDNELGTSYPRGEYLEIIDYDPSTGVFYTPVDLNNQHTIMEEGLAPDINNPQFHQQMVYAVIMTTINNFEKALGRKIQWSDRSYQNEKGEFESEFVERLNVFPHAVRQANAFYHPDKKSLLFGYFEAFPASASLHMPGSTVFTCLSHDIIAHETTHAILDGLHRRYIEPSHPDTRAFHEAFADITALFQHFSFSEVLEHQIAKTKGNLESQNLLGQLAQEFGKAVGSYGSLRDAIGSYDKQSKKWVMHEGNPMDYQTNMEFHDRGAVLVSAIFSAFISAYKKRIHPILRIATGGTGVLPEGELHPDLVRELSAIAAKTAGHVLRICVRALDYCPPIDITFGDYLRAIITADKDMVSDDDMDYRIAFIEAFQKRGVFAKGLKNMSVESLCYKVHPETNAAEGIEKIFVDFLREFSQEIGYETDRGKIHDITRKFITGSKEFKMGIHQRINLKFIQGPGGKRFSEISGLLFPGNEKDCKDLGLIFSRSTGAKFQIGNLWLAVRATPEGKIVRHVVITLLQKRGVIASLDHDRFSVTGYFTPNTGEIPENGFIFRGGCTLIFDLDALRLRYAVKKDIDDIQRMEQQFRYSSDLRNAESAHSLYLDNEEMASLSGPFSFMHSLIHH